MRGMLRLAAAVGAVGALAWLGVTLLAESPHRPSTALLPPICGHRLGAPLGSSGPFDLYYRVSGCQAVSDDIGANMGASLAHALSSISSLGLPTPPGPIAVEVLSQATPQALLGHDSDAGALILPQGASDLDLAQSVGELSLGYALPGLSPSGRQEVAQGFAIYAGGTSGLGQVPDGSPGLFDAWIMSRLGPAPVRAALSSCQSACSWPHALDEALLREGHDPQALRDEFASGRG
jgi:hypothetical protein